eukprot:TRINITY_DN45154_c0_g1_i1.p1 TRINITY_DN45154_c0_g1~~TRINITY_DN45154_c0_g1_i1.p1  ORF type:complete len:419 (+),score=80.26 TRINITY_DN45154_c0_g1_i1:169-1425(+)
MRLNGVVLVAITGGALDVPLPQLAELGSALLLVQSRVTIVNSTLVSRRKARLGDIVEAVRGWNVISDPIHKIDIKFGEEVGEKILAEEVDMPGDFEEQPLVAKDTPEKLSLTMRLLLAFVCVSLLSFLGACAVIPSVNACLGVDYVGRSKGLPRRGTNRERRPSAFWTMRPAFGNGAEPRIIRGAGRCPPIPAFETDPQARLDTFASDEVVDSFEGTDGEGDAASTGTESIDSVYGPWHCRKTLSEATIDDTVATFRDITDSKDGNTSRGASSLGELDDAFEGDVAVLSQSMTSHSGERDLGTTLKDVLSSSPDGHKMRAENNVTPRSDGPVLLLQRRDALRDDDAFAVARAAGSALRSDMKFVDTPSMNSSCAEDCDNFHSLPASEANSEVGSPRSAHSHVTLASALSLGSWRNSNR